jgi:translocation and assembly module TamB
MRALARVLRWIGAALGTSVLLALAAFGLVQTSAGAAWLTRTIAAAGSTPVQRLSIDGLRGIVPFRFSIERIALADRVGPYVTLRDVGVEVRVAALFAGRLEIRALTVGEITVARPSTAKSTTPIVDYLRVPHLPIAVALNRLSIDRLVLEAPVLGERVVAALAGHAAIAAGRAAAGLDLHRIDGQPGRLRLQLALAGATPQLTLHVAANEPSGVLADRLLRRADHLPLWLAVDGSGPLSDWHGRLAAAAGALARIDAQLSLAVAPELRLGLSGSATAAPLLPPQFAPIVGDRVAFALHALNTDDRLVLDRLAIAAAGGSLTGTVSRAGAAIAAKLHLEIPHLSRLAGLFGEAAHGSAVLAAVVGGSERRPRVVASLSGTGIAFGGYAAARVTTDLWLTPQADLDNPQSRVAIAAKGRIEQLGMPRGSALAPGLDRDIDWSLAASAARDGDAIDLDRLAVNGLGLSLAAAGNLAEGGRVITGRASLSVADLRPFSALAGRPIAGSVVLEGAAERQGANPIETRLDGRATDFHTGIPAADALLGGRVALDGALRRNADGLVILDKLVVAGADAKFSAAGRYDPRPNRLAATGTVEVPRLQPLGAALGGTFAGAVSARADIDGALDRLHAAGRIEGQDIAARGMRMDRLRLDVQVADLARPEPVIDGSFRAAGLDGTLALTAAMNGPSELAIPRLRLAAAGGAVGGKLQIGLDSGLVQGSIEGRIPDLARWSGLAGSRLGGGVSFAAGFASRGGQALDLTATGSGLAVGTGKSGLAIGRLDLVARLTDLERAASGTGRLSLSSVRIGGGSIASAQLRFDSLRPGRFAFTGNATGRPLSLTLAGDIGVEPGGVGLRLARLDGSLGSEKFRLDAPFLVSRHGADLGFSHLDFALGPGRITGNGGLKGEALALQLNAADLRLAAAADALGHRGVEGALSFSATLGGTVAAPRGRLALNARHLGFALPTKAHPGNLGLTIDADWNGHSLGVDGKVTGLPGDTIGLSGSLPLLLTRAPIGVSLPPQGRLALKVEGLGRLDHLADLLPIGEDRLSGKFAADLAVGGTVAAPAASGKLTLADADYENFASGAVLKKMNATLVGDRDRLTLSTFSAADSASGAITAMGGITLDGAAGPTTDLSASLRDFRIAARDEAVVTASGRVSIAGPLTGPKITAPLTIDRADINLPSSLPPNVVVIPVVVTGSRPGKSPPPATAPVSANLDITLDLPGKIFVRGHGLDSEWRGRLRINGTSTAPRIAGTVKAIRGTFDILGKSFRVTRGLITFDGSARVDPTLDITAEVAASDIMAQIMIGGLASAPKLTLTSTPALPQDEILARVLFNQNTTQITPAQGLALAQAAATLTGGGPGVIDRLRGNLGLDWLRLGQTGAGASSGVVNRNPNNPSSTNGTAISAGKYIANGVSIGVTQGVSPPTSQVTVEVQLGHHVTVSTSAGQNGGTGIGVNYNYDY